MHRDIVYDYPPGTEPLGSSPRCQVQGMYAKNRLISVQGHPEFREDIMTEILTLRTAAGIFSKEQSEDAFNRAGIPHDGIAITMAFLKLLI